MDSNVWEMASSKIKKKTFSQVTIQKPLVLSVQLLREVSDLVHERKILGVLNNLP